MQKTMIAATAAAMVLIPVTANAAGSSHQLAAKTPKPPVKGAWKVVNDAYVPEVTGGSMKVTSGHKDIKDVVVKLGAQAETSCGVAGTTFKIPAKEKIFDAKGENASDNFAAYSFWAVGKNDPNADPVIQPHAVKLYINGKKRNAKFWMRFVGQKKGNGEITFGTANSCQLDFGFKRG